MSSAEPASSWLSSSWFRAVLGRQRPIGVVDTRGARIQGWAHDPTTEGPVTIEVLVDGVSVGTTVADRYRADLTSVTADGRCAFAFALPADAADGQARSIEVRAQGTNKPLHNGRFAGSFRANEYYLGMVHWILRSGVWSMAVARDGASLALEGWYLAPPGAGDPRIMADGRAIELTTSPGYDGWQSPLPPGVVAQTFTGKIDAPQAAEAVKFSFGAARAFRPLHDLHFPLFEIDIPPAEQRKRVDGHGSEARFNLGGYSNALKLDAMSRRFAGRPLRDAGPVLDWGCGCGRVARFVARSGADLYGVDIDRENALWCRDHINSNFSAIPPDPPTPFSDGFFELVYGLSVFTHLTRDYEEAWLAELYRIAKPGALLLLSVHGGMISAHSGLLEHVMSSEFVDGFVDIGRNSDIDVVTAGSGYYRNTFHEPGYIARVWGRYFEILSIEEAIIENMQDLVVARKPL